MNRKVYLFGGIALAVILVVTLVAVLLPKSTLPANKSAQQIYFVNLDNSVPTPGPWKFTDNVIASADSSKMDATLTCPDTATGVFAFVSSRGAESQINGGWQAFSESGFIMGTPKVLEPSLQLSGLYLGSPGAQYLKKIGGDFSLGVACTSAEKNNVLAVSYRYIRIEAGSGDWQIVSN